MSNGLRHDGLTPLAERPLHVGGPARWVCQVSDPGDDDGIDFRCRDCLTFAIGLLDSGQQPDVPVAINATLPGYDRVLWLSNAVRAAVDAGVLRGTWDGAA